MRASILVCTFGAAEWEDCGRELHSILSSEEPTAAEVMALHQPHGTLAGVRNEAARLASGDWLCFVDADDELEPGYLDAMRSAYMHGAITMDWSPLLVPAVAYMHPDGRTDPPGIPAWGMPIEDVNCAVIGTLVRRKMFLDVGGFPELPALEDWACWLACVRAGAQLVPVPEAVYKACVHPEGRNQDQSLYRRIRDEHLALTRRDETP